MEASEKPKEPLMLRALCDKFHANIAEVWKLVWIKQYLFLPNIETSKTKLIYTFSHDHKQECV